MDVPADIHRIQISMGVYLGTHSQSDRADGSRPLLEPAGPGTVVLWRILDGADTGTLSDEQSVVEDVRFNVDTTLTTGTRAGATYTVEGRVSVLVDGERICHCGEHGPSKVCAPLTVTPGLAASIVFDVPRATLPADKKSDVTITLTARDKHNNLVQDGTSVDWHGGSGLGWVTAIDDETKDGQARATIEAGFLEGDQTVEVQVDSCKATLTIPYQLILVTVASDAAQLSVVASPDSSIPTATTITAHCVDSSGVPVADGAIVKFFASNGSWAGSSFGAVARVPASGGRASAILNAEGFRTGSTLVAAGVTNFAGSMRLPFVTAGNSLSVTTDRGVISGDAAVDGTIPMEQSDGPTRAIPYYTSVTAMIAGGSPDGRITIKLQGAGARLVKLPAGSNVTLDSQGNATFAIHSKGNFRPGAAPQDLLIAVTQGKLTAQTVVKVVSKEWYASFRNIASVFAWGDPLGAAATADDFATGMLSWGTIRDAALQIPNWATGQRSSYTQMGFSALDIVIDFFRSGPF